MKLQSKVTHPLEYNFSCFPFKCLGFFVVKVDDVPKTDKD